MQTRAHRVLLSNDVQLGTLHDLRGEGTSGFTHHCSTLRLGPNLCDRSPLLATGGFTPLFVVFKGTIATTCAMTVAIIETGFVCLGLPSPFPSAPSSFGDFLPFLSPLPLPFLGAGSRALTVPIKPSFPSSPEQHLRDPCTRRRGVSRNDRWLLRDCLGKFGKRS